MSRKMYGCVLPRYIFLNIFSKNNKLYQIFNICQKRKF